MVWRTAVGAALCLLAVAPYSWAGATLQASPDTFVEVGLQLQVLGQLNKNQAGTEARKPDIGGDAYDAYLRRGRLMLAGQVTPMADFYVALSGDNAGKNFGGSTTSLLDSWVQFNLSPQAKLMAGIFPVQFTRERLSSTASLVTVERSFMDKFQLDSGGLVGKRDRGVLLWGNLGGFQYRFAAGNGAPPLQQNIGSQSLRVHGRVHATYGDGEKGFRYQEGYLGEKNVFTVGYGIDRQNNVSTDGAGNPSNYNAWTADAFLESKSEAGSTTLGYSYYSYHWGDANRTDSSGNYVQGDGWDLLFAYAGLQKGSGFQPYARYGSWNANSTTPGASQRHMIYGLNVLLKGKNAKWGFEFEQVRFPLDGATWDLRGYDKYSLQWQIVY